MMRKTRGMLSLENQHGQPLEELLLKLFREREMGPAAAARYLGMSHTTLLYWLWKLGIRFEIVVAGQGDIVAIRKHGGAVMGDDVVWKEQQGADKQEHD